MSRRRDMRHGAAGAPCCGDGCCSGRSGRCNYGPERVQLAPHPLFRPEPASAALSIKIFASRCNTAGRDWSQPSGTLPAPLGLVHLRMDSRELPHRCDEPHCLALPANGPCLGARVLMQSLRVGRRARAPANSWPRDNTWAYWWGRLAGSSAQALLPLRINAVHHP